MSEGEDKGAMKPKGLNSIVNIDWEHLFSEGEDKWAMKPKGLNSSQHRLRTPMSEGEDKGAVTPKGLNSIVNID